MVSPLRSLPLDLALIDRGIILRWDDETPSLLYNPLTEKLSFRILLLGSFVSLIPEKIKSSKLREDVVPDGCRNMDRRCCGCIVSEVAVVVVLDGSCGLAEVDVTDAILVGVPPLESDLGNSYRISHCCCCENNVVEDDIICGAVVCRCIVNGNGTIGGVCCGVDALRSIRFVFFIVAAV